MRETMLREPPAHIEDPKDDILAQGWLHRLMVWFNKPANWPDLLLGLVLLSVAATAGLVWWGITEDVQTARVVMVLLALVLGVDITLLHSLPARGISYGPWQSQFVVLAIPRWLATAVTAVLADWVNLSVGIGIFLAIQVSGLAALIWATEIEPFRLRLTEFIMFSDRLPPGSKPIRILHITDLHIERLTQREEKVIELAQEANPDLILITGDYVNLSYNRDPETHQQVWQLLRRLRAPYGVYATLGSPTVDVREEIAPIFDRLPIPLLRQEWETVSLGDGRQLVLLGLDCTHHLPTDGARLAQLVEDVPPDVPQILLYHSPELMPQAAAWGIDLYVCGHTHGGQVRLPFIGPLLTSSQLGRKYVMGLYRLGRTHLYVSRGLGLEGLSAPRVRFLCPPEMTLITLRPPSL